MRSGYPAGRASTPGTVATEMSATLQATGLAAGHGARVLFSGLDLVLAPGDVVGLVGANGAGKSTLLRILAGESPPEQGAVTISPPAATVGHLPQEPERRPGETVAAFLARRTGVAQAQDAMDAAAEALGAGAPGADDTYAAALDRWLALGGADLDERAGAVADDVGLGVALDTPMTALSGGQAARAGLAALLLSRYDVLLLDEPTNDLDLDGLERLERFVRLRRSERGLRRRQPRPRSIVSHDREFLARTVNRVVELDLAQQQVGVYEGGYDSYLAEREVARRHAREAYEEYDDRLGGLKDRAQMQRNWMAQGVRNARRKSDRQRQDRPQQARRDQREAGGEGPADAAADRAARRRRGAAQGVGAADDDRRGAALGDGRGVAVRRGRAPRVVHPRAGRRPGRLGGPGRGHRGERVGQDDAAGRAARPDPARRGQRRAGAVGAGRGDRPGARAVPRAGAADAGVPATRCRIDRATTGPSRTCARCWPSSG